MLFAWPFRSKLGIDGDTRGPGLNNFEGVYARSSNLRRGKDQSNPTTMLHRLQLPSR
jgi:hypothetical protein